jgi:hypothetical protein
VSFLQCAGHRLGLLNGDAGRFQAIIADVSYL